MYPFAMPLITELATLTLPARRIVSLVPSLTESVAELGAADRLAGVTDWCWYPEEIVAPLPKVGGTKTPNLDRIRALNPDVILVNEEENRRADVEALAADFNCLVTFPKAAHDNARLVALLGELVACEGQAAQVQTRIEALEADLRARVAGRPRRSIAYLIWRKPYMTINRDTYVHSVLELLGCTNPWADHEDRYPSLTVDDVQSADPDLVCLSSEPFPFDEKHIAEFAQEFPMLAAVQQSRVYVDDGTFYCWYGTRWVRALESFIASPWYA